MCGLNVHLAILQPAIFEKEFNLSGYQVEISGSIYYMG